MTSTSESNHSTPGTALVSPIPPGYGTVTPFIAVKGAAQLLDFLATAFDAQELGRVQNEDGTIGHAETKIGDSIVMLFDAKPEWPDMPSLLRLYVNDAHATLRQAVAAGAIAITEVTHLPWGDITGRVRDPFGNIWWIMTRLENLDEAEITRRYGEQQFIDAMRYVESAEFFPTH